jgi:hypothetical protein
LNAGVMELGVPAQIHMLSILRLKFVFNQHRRAFRRSTSVLERE